MHQDPSGMLARIPFGLTTGPIEGAEILVAGCRKETVASEMRSNVLKYRDTLNDTWSVSAGAVSGAV